MRIGGGGGGGGDERAIAAGASWLHQSDPRESAMAQIVHCHYAMVNCAVLNILYGNVFPI